MPTGSVPTKVMHWWPLLVAVVAVAIAWGETRWWLADLGKTVDRLEFDDTVDTGQGELLADHGLRIVKLEAFNDDNFETLGSDQRMWGALLDQWPRRLIQMDDHERRLIQIETLQGRPIGGQ